MYSGRHLVFAGLLGLLLGALAVASVHAGTSRSASEPVSWVPVHIEAPNAADRSATVHPCETSGLWETAEDSQRDSQGYRPEGACGASPILDPATPTQSVERPAVAPTAELHIVSKAPVAPQGGNSVTGIASYYAWHPGEAAAGPALRVGDWRGRVVTVCASACVVVRLSDFCQCYGSRVIDLDSRSFAALAPLSAGLVTVTVRWN